MTFQEIQQKLSSKQISVEEIVKNYLTQIQNKKSLNAFIDVFENEAIENAISIDKKIQNGNAGKLAGMVIAVKNNIAIQNHLLTCGSKILENFKSLFDATAISRLKKEDALFIGATNLDEFAMGSSTETSYFGVTKNPIDETRVCGGSSGGSAVAVAANMSTVALGSETGGSVRQPSAFCGVYGLKPTYGRISRYGLVAYGSSLDQIGICGNSVYDIALTLETISGVDENDSTSANVIVDNYISNFNKNIKGLKVGIPKEYFTDGLNAEIKESIFSQIEILKSNGVEVVEISLPNSEYTIPTYLIIAMAEASSNLARFDGARYGYRANDVKTLLDMYIKSRSVGFGDEVKRRIMIGTYVLSSGYYDAYYRKAQKVRRLIYQDYVDVFRKVDFIITPTTPTTAFKIGEKISDPVTMYLQDIFTVSANLAGICGISIPIGKDKLGLPIGMQILGKHFDEKTILNVANFIERK